MHTDVSSDDSGIEPIHPTACLNRQEKKRAAKIQRSDLCHYLSVLLRRRFLRLNERTSIRDPVFSCDLNARKQITCFHSIIIIFKNNRDCALIFGLIAKIASAKEFMIKE